MTTDFIVTYILYFPLPSSHGRHLYDFSLHNRRLSSFCLLPTRSRPRVSSRFTVLTLFTSKQYDNLIIPWEASCYKRRTLSYSLPRLLAYKFLPPVVSGVFVFRLHPHQLGASQVAAIVFLYLKTKTCVLLASPAHCCVRSTFCYFGLAVISMETNG